MLTFLLADIYGQKGSITVMELAMELDIFKESTRAQLEYPNITK